MRTLLAAVALLLSSAPALAERLVSMVSRDEVAITSSFAGETLTLFGNIEPEAGAAQKFVEGPFNVVIVITGPLQDRVARFSEPVFGIWMNTQQAVFDNFPSYYQVLSSGALDTMMPAATLDALDILPEDQVRLALVPGAQNGLTLGRELVRLMTEEGQVAVNPNGVVFRSTTFYAAQITLPSDVQSGPFLAHTYLFKNGELLTEHTEGFTVRKVGFERFLGQAATSQPLLYGLVCVVLALFTGWLGGVVFKR
jgi:uncharacterized protein (TIGR02186 family)